MAIFEIKFVFDFKSRNRFVIGGEILEGTINNGMVIQELGYTIKGVDVIDFRLEKRFLVGLSIYYESNEALEEMKNQLQEGLKITIE